MLIYNAASLSSSNLFIGTKYVSIPSRLISDEVWWHVGLTVPKSSYMKSFDREIREEIHPVRLFFGSSDPYIVEIKTLSVIDYYKGLKSFLKSEEYKECMSKNHSPFAYGLAEINSLDDLPKFFPENKSFGEAMKGVVEDRIDLSTVKSLLFGKIIFKSFTVDMDAPVKGLFVDTAAINFADEPIYIRSLTYGSLAYFVVASDLPYKDVLDVFMHSNVVDSHKDPKGALHTSQIVLLTAGNGSNTTWANVDDTFESLEEYLKRPFGSWYGFPIYCIGAYVKDNKSFIINQ